MKIYNQSVLLQNHVDRWENPEGWVPATVSRDDVAQITTEVEAMKVLLDAAALYIEKKYSETGEAAVSVGLKERYESIRYGQHHGVHDVSSLREGLGGGLAGAGGALIEAAAILNEVFISLPVVQKKGGDGGTEFHRDGRSGTVQHLFQSVLRKADIAMSDAHFWSHYNPGDENGQAIRAEGRLEISELITSL